MQAEINLANIVVSLDFLKETTTMMSIKTSGSLVPWIQFVAIDCSSFIGYSE